MFRVALFIACLRACTAHAVQPVAHAVVAPVVPYAHGLGGLGHGAHGYASPGLNGYYSLGHHGYAQGLIGHGYTGHGLLGHGYGAHHVLKRSPHYVPVGHLGVFGHGTSIGHLGGTVGHVGAIGHVAPVVPVAVSHQSRVDVRSSPAFVAPVLPVNVGLAPLHYGSGHYGSPYSHLGHY